MANHMRRKVTGGGRGSGVVALRALVVVPAAVTLLLLGASALRRAAPEGELPEGGVVLRSAERSVALGEPRFGPPSPEVFSATAAVETESGWVVLDARSQQIVFLDPAGAVVGLSGGEGSGPGEIQGASLLARLGSLLLVSGPRSGSIDVFSEGGEFQRRLPLEPPECGAARLHQLVGGDAVAALLWLCVEGTGTRGFVQEIDREGNTRQIADRVVTEGQEEGVVTGRAPLLVRAGGRLHFGVTYDRCVFELESAPGGPAARCHPERVGLPVPDSVLQVVRAQLPPGPASASIVLPDRLPPFDELVTVGDELAFHVILGERDHALDVVRGDGLERIIMPPGLRFSVGTRSVLFTRDALEGTAFAVVALPR